MRLPFRECFLSFFVALGFVLPAQAQPSDRWVMAEKPIEKKSSSGHLANMFSTYLNPVFREKEKWTYVFEYKNRQYAFSKYDAECRLLEEGLVQCDDIDWAKTDTRIRKVVPVEDGFFINYELHDKKETCRSYVQKFDLSLRKAGNKIFVDEHKQKYNFISAGNSYTHLNYVVDVSADGNKWLFFYPFPFEQLVYYHGIDGAHSLEGKYRVLDVKTEEVKTHFLNIKTSSGVSRTLFEEVLNDGRVLVVVHQKTGVKDKGKSSLLYRLLGDPTDSSYTEIPMPGLAIRDYRFSLTGNQLAFVSTYFPTKGDRILYENQETGFGGIYFGKVDVSARKEILLRKMPAQELLSPFEGLKYREGVLTSSEIKIQQAIFREDGETDLFLVPYYYNGTDFKSNSMLVVRMDKDENLAFVRAIADGVNFSGSDSPVSHHGYKFYLKGKTTYMITFENKWNTKPQKRYAPISELDHCVLSVTRIDPEGNIKKTYDSPIEIREKHFVNLRFTTHLDEDTDRLYFFATRAKALKDFYWPGVYKIPLD